MIARATRRKDRRPALAERELTLAWQAVSLLLGYPDEELLDRLDLLLAASHELPAAIGEGIREIVVRLQRTPVQQLQEEYVETFDSRRRCNLYLTYFAHGDTRKRGMALLRFKQTFAASGFDLTDDELPDHLSVVLEYAATIDPEQGLQLLLDHRAGLEVLRMSLREASSPWAPVVESLCATLPALNGEEHAAVRRLAVEGPPEEEVGLTTYGSTDLGMPTVRPASAPASRGAAG